MCAEVQNKWVCNSWQVLVTLDPNKEINPDFSIHGIRLGMAWTECQRSVNGADVILPLTHYRTRFIWSIYIKVCSNAWAFVRTFGVHAHVRLHVKLYENLQMHSQKHSHGHVNCAICPVHSLLPSHGVPKSKAWAGCRTTCKIIRKSLLESTGKESFKNMYMSSGQIMACTRAVSIR